MHIYYEFRYFPRDIIPRATSQLTISQVATPLMFKFPSGHFPKVKLGPLRRRMLQLGPSDAARRPSARLEQDGGPSAAGRTYLGSCHLGNCTFGKLPLGKKTLRSCHLGKNPWEAATWGKFFGKVSNIILRTFK